MAWQSDEIQPYSSSPADDIFKIQNDLSVIKAILEGGTDAEVASVMASNSYADAGDAATLASAKSYSDSGDAATLASANAAIATATAQIFPVLGTVNANALTLTLNPCSINFRNATLTTGTTNKRTVGSAISVVVPSGATLGTANARQARIYLLAIDNAGTVELAVINSAGGNNLDETGLISTTAISAAATAANVAYSTTARTNVPYRVVGFVDITEATAGTWATAPTLVQGFGGQAGAAMSSMGHGQTWQDVTGSRVAGTTYYNTTGKPIFVSVISTTNNGVALNVNGAQVSASTYSSGAQNTACVVAPPGASYSMSAGGAFAKWSELR